MRYITLLLCSIFAAFVIYIGHAAAQVSFPIAPRVQLEDLTPAEIAYRDSIAKLNSQNDAIAKSQEAYNKGIQLFGEKNYKGAIEQFSTSVKLDPKFTGAFYNKGVAENEAELYTEASKTLNELINIDPNYSKAYFQRGRAF